MIANHPPGSEIIQRKQSDIEIAIPPLLRLELPLRLGLLLRPLLLLVELLLAPLLLLVELLRPELLLRPLLPTVDPLGARSVPGAAVRCLRPELLPRPPLLAVEPLGSSEPVTSKNIPVRHQNFPVRRGILVLTIYTSPNTPRQREERTPAMTET
ncbi:hypothetical protein Bbelb_376660 [Branchiostoma belcheri]|nr:hypothetical protein Bbelb_376660 [Branchiostoma belcheri]